MALKVGELVAYMQMDDKGFVSGAKGVEQTMGRLQAETTKSTSALERDVSASFARVADAISDGVDPTDALADLGRLTDGFQTGMGEMESDARTGAQGVVNAINDSLGDLEEDARRAGQDGGRGLTQGLDDALGDAKQVARKHGDDAGREFGDGTEQTGRSRMSGVGGNLIGVLKGLGWLTAGAAIGGQIMDGLASAMDAEDAKAKLNAQVGAFGDDAKRLGEVAGQVYANAWGDSMGEVTEAVGAVQSTLDSLGAVGKGQLDELTTNALILAEAFDADVNDAVASVGILLKTGLAKDAEEAFDIITTGLQKVPAAVRDDLTEASDEYSVFFQGLGFNAKEAFGVLVEAAKGGKIQLDKAGDALKEFKIRGVDMSATSIEAYKALGLNARGMASDLLAGGDTAKTAFQKILDGILGIKDPIEQSKVATALFGTQFEDLGNIDALAALRPMTNALGEVEGATKKTGDELQSTASKKFTAFKNSLELNVTEFIGGEVLPALESLWDSFKAGDLDEDLEALGTKISDAFGGIKDDIVAWADENQETLQGLKDKFDETFGQIIETVGGAVDFIKAIWDEWGDEIMTTVTTVVDTVLGFIEGFFEMIGGIFKIGTGVITGDWEKVWDGIKDTVSGALKGVLNIVDNVLQEITKDWSTSWDDMKKVAGKKLDEMVENVKKIPGQLKAIWDNAGSLLKAAGQAIIQGLIDGLASKVAELGAKLGEITQYIKDHKGPLDKDRQLLVPAGAAIIDGLIDGMKGSESKLQGALDSLTGLIKRGFGNAPTSDPLIDFIAVGTEKLSDLADRREALLQRIADAKKYAQEIEQQAKDFASITNIEDPAGVGDLTGGLKDRLQAMKDFAANIQELAKRGLNKETLRQIIDAGVEGGGSLAEMLVGGDNAEIKALNKAQKQIDSMSKKLGKVGADALYDVGKKAGAGYLKGLEAEMKKLDSLMKKIVDALVKAIKKELKIKSPSQVMADIGQQTMDGLIVGIDGATPTVLDHLKTIGKQMGDAVASSAQAAISGNAYQATPEEAQLKKMLGGAKFGLDVQGLNPDASATSKTPGSIPPSGPTGGDGSLSPGSAGPPIVNVDMRGSTVREDADVNRLGNEFGFNLAAYG